MYDDGGNREKKLEAANPAVNPLIRYEEDYEYDIEDTANYGTNNNRLMKIVRTQIETGTGQQSATAGPGLEFQSVGGEPLAPGGGGGPAPAAPGGGGPTETVTTVWTKYYFYSTDGNVFDDEGTVERVVKKVEGEHFFSAVRFGFADNERTVTHVIGEKWDDPAVAPFQPYEVTFARQFRYDGARQRYLNRELDPDQLELGITVDLLGSTPVWSDYDGNSIYADWTVDTGVVELRSHQPGLAITDQLAGGGSANTTYLHTSALGSTMATSNSSGVGTFDTAYTAFGETVMGQTERYGFAGEWGYQSHGDFDFMHLGHRYYNPSTGRFLQRDPIGIFGDINVYLYAGNDPLGVLDPSGLKSTWQKIKDEAKNAWEAIKKAAGYGTPTPPGASPAVGALECAPGAIRAYMKDAKRRHRLKDHPDDPTEDCKRCNEIDDIVNPPNPPKSKPNPPGGGAGG